MTAQVVANPIATDFSGGGISLLMSTNKSPIKRQMPCFSASQHVDLWQPRQVATNLGMVRESQHFSVVQACDLRPEEKITKAGIGMFDALVGRARRSNIGAATDADIAST